MSRLSRFHRRRSGASLIALVIAAGLAAQAPSLAQAETADTSPPQAVRVAAGALDAALLSLAAQTGQQLLYRPELVAGRRTAGLAGRYTPDQAVARLIADPQIEVVRLGPHAMALKRRAAGAAADTAARPFAEAGAALPGSAGDRSDGPAGTAPAGAAPLTTAGAEAPASATLLSEVTVTGSHIRGAAPDAPVRILDRAAIARSGQSTIAGVLNQLPQVFGGLNTEGTVATGADAQGSNTSYGTGVNLRGLGSNATLVLVNGRRMAGSGASGDFADLASIPAIAVSRVEVLLDGASAVYGSDAVGGVVNLILRRDLEGGEVRASAGTGAHGTPREYQFGAALGHAWGGGGLLLAYEAYQRGALAAADRSYTASSDLRPQGGTDHRLTTAFPGNVVGLDPATGLTGPYWGIPAGQDGTRLAPGDFLPGQLNRADRQHGLDVLPQQRRQGGYLAAHQDVGGGLELSGDLRYGFRAARTHLAPQTSSLTVRPANPYFVSPTGAASAQIAYSFEGELPNPVVRATAKTLTGSIGARYALPHDWAADGYLGLARERDRTDGWGLVNSALLSEALGNVADRPETAYSPARDGYFNPFAGVAANAPAVLAAVGSGYSRSRTQSEVRTVNLQADGPLFDLPGGTLKLAVGAVGRRESFRRQGVSFTSSVAPSPQKGVAGARTVGALFAELRAPLVGPANALPGVQALELSAAIRAERYSDFGRTTDPRVGLVWSPLRDLRLRATYGRSFRAPGLNQLLSQESVSPILFAYHGQDVLAVSRQGGNPDLRPETADTWTAGLDYQPSWAPGARLSLTAFDTDFKNRISRPVNDNLAQALVDPRFAPFVQFVSPKTSAPDRALVESLLTGPIALSSAGLFPATDYVAIVDLRNVNTGELRVRGLDLEASWELAAWGGQLRLGAEATRLLDYDQRLTPTSAASDRLGLAGYPAKLRGQVSADWSRGPVSAGATLNRTAALHDAQGARIAGLTTVDARLRLQGTAGALAGTALQLSVRNLFDKAPPFWDNPLGFAYDPANADVVGRFVRLELTRSW